MARAPKRFYQNVETAADADGAYRILLDGKPVRTPAQQEFRLPNAQLAEAIADEWRKQETQIQFARMPLTRLAFTAIDRVMPNREASIEQIVSYGNADVICYRAVTPADLAERQQRVWNPLLDWAAQELGVAFVSSEGLAFVSQPEESLAKLRDVLAGGDAFTLVATQTAAELCGSVIIGLTLNRGFLDSDAAFLAAHLDELYQAEKWGEDYEAKERRADRAQSLRETTRFLKLLSNA